MEQINKTMADLDLPLNQTLKLNIKGCDIHGAGAVRLDGVCVDCERHKQTIEDRKKAAMLVADGTRWGVPKRFAKASISDFKNMETIDNNQSIFITGRCGTGKTHKAVAMAKEYSYENGYDNTFCKYVNFQKLAIDIKCSFGKDSTAMNRIIAETCVEMLILDDIGSHGTPAPTTIDALYLIVNDRYEKEYVTIYTTNMSYEEIAKTYGDRIASRLIDCRKIEMNGVDRRLKK